MNRPTIDDVKAAVAKTGVRLTPRTYFDYEEFARGRVCCCVLAALAIADGAMDVSGPGAPPFPACKACDWGRDRFGDAYLRGLMCGFDNEPKPTDIEKDPDCQEGYALGVECRTLIEA